MLERSVAVVGASGYLGAEAVRLLSGHPSLHLTQAVSAHHSGEPLSKILPWIPRSQDLRLASPSDPLDVDAAILALPSGESLRVVPDLLARGIRVVDLGADYRLTTPGLYEKVYGRVHTDPEGLASAVYGLTELNRERIATARLVANPGCYPTATLLALVPLARAGVLPPHVIVDAKSGTSGAGAAPGPLTHHSEAAASVTPYGDGMHRHLPEIRQALGMLAGTPAHGSPGITFSPHLVPLVRGILCSIYAPGVDPTLPEPWMHVLEAAYADCPFVRLGSVPKLPWATGSNACLLHVQASPPSLVVFSAIDNLVKGGAGQALQNLNVMYGLPETTGLPLGGLGI